MLPGQLEAMFHMFIRSKYHYGLAITGTDERTVNYYYRWEDAALKSLCGDEVSNVF